MKNICTIFLTVFLFIACSLNGIDEDKSIIDETMTVIDVRTEQEYKKGYLKNAVNIPHGIIEEKIAALVPGREEPIIVYCRSGRRSGIAKKVLNEMGYTNVINAGSYKKLKKNEPERAKK